MPYSTRFEDALVYAARLHRDQVRKGSKIPYVTHLLAVAAIVGENGGSEDQVIAALLHDAAEDQGGEATIQEIGNRFGADVAEMVADCSDTLATPKPPWLARKQAYIAHLAEVRSESLLVSLADKVHNAQSIVQDLKTIGFATFDKFTGGAEGALWYYSEILQALEARIQGPLTDRLHELVGLMRELAGRPQ